jgi:hypothetical protein
MGLRRPRRNDRTATPVRQLALAAPDIGGLLALPDAVDEEVVILVVRVWCTPLSKPGSVHARCTHRRFEQLTHRCVVVLGANCRARARRRSQTRVGKEKAQRRSGRRCGRSATRGIVQDCCVTSGIEQAAMQCRA